MFNSIFVYIKDAVQFYYYPRFKLLILLFNLILNKSDVIELIFR